jgi:hypothetical protein
VGEKISMSDDEMTRFQEKLADKQTKINTEGVSWGPILFNLSALVGSSWIAGWPGFAFGLYVVFGVSLARRVAQGRYNMKWLAVTLLWPILLLVDTGRGVLESD